MMKRYIPWLCCLLLLCGLAACGGTGTPSADESANPESAETAVVDDLQEAPATPTSADSASTQEGGDMDEDSTIPGSTEPTDSENAAIGDSGLPLYPGAQAPPRNSDTATIVELLQARIAQQTGLEDVQTEINGYILPEEAEFEQVRDFYREELTELGWEPMEGATAMDAVAVADIGAASWAKNDNEVFIILVMNEAAVSENSILITVLGLSPEE
jgi:predicted small lipoprotein YifL